MCIGRCLVHSRDLLSSMIVVPFPSSLRAPDIFCFRCITEAVAKLKDSSDLREGSPVGMINKQRESQRVYHVLLEHWVGAANSVGGHGPVFPEGDSLSGS